MINKELMTVNLNLTYDSLDATLLLDGPCLTKTEGVLDDDDDDII